LGATFAVDFFKRDFTFFEPAAADFFTLEVADFAEAFADFSALAAIFDAFFTAGFAISVFMVLAASLTAKAILPAAFPMVFAAVSKMPLPVSFGVIFFFAIFGLFYRHRSSAAAIISPQSRREPFYLIADAQTALDGLRLAPQFPTRSILKRG
jgi:hypothetical protein